MKLCPRCRIQKEDTEFGKNKLHRSGLDTYCKACRYEDNKAYRLKNAEKVSKYRKNYYSEHKEAEKARMKEYRQGAPKKTTAPIMRKGREARLRRTFNLSPEEYALMLEKQNGVCAICGGTNKSGSYLHVDHDHATGMLRSLLCNTCNLALGLVHEKISTLQAMIHYLNQYSKKE